MDKALELAKEIAKPFEGLRLKAYHDPVGFPTIGYGHLLSRKRWEDLSIYKDITKEEAEILLMGDMNKALRSVLRLCPNLESPQQVAAIVDFTFNVGAGNLEISTLRRLANRGEYEAASEQFKRWVFAAGVKLPGLVKRRNLEARLFLTGS